MFCELSELHNESDVEQKFIAPLLTNPVPKGLGLASNMFATKEFLKQEIIDKGKKTQSYAPDYLIQIKGIPLAVIEAKHPQESVEEGFRQAQLYAQVVNSAFPHNTNPCSKIIACNGNILVAGYYDSKTYEIKMEFSDFFVGNILFEKLQGFLKCDVLCQESEKYFKNLHPSAWFIKPISKVGSKRIQNEELSPNNFGVNLAFKFQHVFTPDSEDEKLAIVQNAYVSVKKREHHVDPIYKTIKRDVALSQINQSIIDTDTPHQLCTSIAAVSTQISSRDKKKALILLIGSVGSGKSTFIRHFQHTSLPADISSKTTWLYIDMNSAKASNQGEYDWIAEQIYRILQSKYPEEDFETINMLCQVYREDIQIFDKGLGQLLDKHSPKYKEELYKRLLAIHGNPEKRLKKYVNFLCAKYQQTFIIVFDNCDKQTSEEQLVMFDVAQWLREYFPFLVIMPLRDSTYDAYQNMPPLDTVIKDLTFRIDPPDFLTVLQYRLNYIWRLQKDQLQVEGYNLSGSKHVELKKDEFINYFRSILNSIRQNSFAKDLFYGLASRNIRRGIEIFLNFCRSGHIPAEHFLKMRVTDGSYSLPAHLILNALMKGYRKYYSSNVSCIKNLFASEPTDVPPDPFARLDILVLLNSIVAQKECKYLTVRLLLDKLIAVSHREETIVRELKQLIADELVTYESKAPEFDEQGQITISVAGRQHLRLLRNINYLSACSEDVYYQDTDVAVQISERMKYLSNGENLLNNNYLNAKDLIDYLEDYKNKTFVAVEKLPIKDNEGNSSTIMFNLSPCHEVINGFEKKNQHILESFNTEIDMSLIGKEIPFKISYIAEYGVFGHLGGSIKGFISRKTISDDDFIGLDVGELIQVKVVEYSEKYKRFTVRFVKFISK